MKRYRLLAACNFGPGNVLGLSEAQIAHRAHLAFEPVGDAGGVRCTSPLSFKAGEALGIERLPRAFEAWVEEIPAEADAAAPAAKAAKAGKKAAAAAADQPPAGAA